MKQISYRINRSQEGEIERHLLACSKQFTPPLATYVNIKDYSEKIRNHAITIEAWYNIELIGLLAVYYNDKNNVKGFITNISVESSFLRQGIADNLLNLCIDIGYTFGYEEVELEVHPSNERAMRFYEKNGFKKKEKDLYNIRIER